MKITTIAFACFLILSSCNSNSNEKALFTSNSIAKISSKSKKVYKAISICAERPNTGNKSVFGHAFANWITENPEMKRTEFEYSWGFYPKSTMSGILSFTGPVEGTFKDDWLGKRHLDVCIYKKVSNETYQRALKLKDNYEFNRATYELSKEDCLSFIIELSNTIGLNVPTRKKLELPHQYVNRLKTLNE